VEGRIVGKPTTGRKKVTYEDVYKNNSYEVLKRKAKTEVHGEKARERKCQKPADSRRY